MKKIISIILMLILMVGTVFAVCQNCQGNCQGKGQHSTGLKDGSGNCQGGGQGSGQGAGLRDGSGNGMGQGSMGQGRNNGQGGYEYQLYDDTQVNHSLEILSLPKEDLSEEEISSLIYMREEEKLARDVYLELYDLYGLQIFSNIARSEEKHTSAIKSLLDKYEIEDPVTSNARGEFTNIELKNLYNSLIEKGKINLSEALVVGATIEDLDIYDLQNDLEKIDNEDMTLVYENLMKASRNHLRSFTKNLERTSGIVYTPQYISQEYYNEIISSNMETGNHYNSQKNDNNLNVNKENNINNMNNQNRGNNVNNINDEKQNENTLSFFAKLFNGFGSWFN